jgi:LmbE family N-acetylglucosaminyl deacetylase
MTPVINRVLVVAAHPDDEVIGCGGTIFRHTDENDEVYILFMADGESSRGKDEDYSLLIQERKQSALRSCSILKTNKPIFLDLPDNGMDAIPLLKVVKELECVIKEIRPNIIYTHHMGDLNIDHNITHQAVMTACRPYPETSIKEIYYFEVLSSTECNSPNITNTFIPNYYVDISSTIEHKLNAVNEYKSEMREYPHVRSVKSIENLSLYRGSSVGLYAAEAFMVGRIIK